MVDLVNFLKEELAALEAQKQVDLAFWVAEQVWGDIKHSCNGMKDLIRGRFLEPDILRSKHEERDVVTISSPGLEFIEGSENVDDMGEGLDLP